jgi:hypothetical protein
MSLTCEKCKGTGVRAAEMRRFVHGGYELCCLAFVSNCMVCGHRWEDPMYDGENTRLVEQAIEAATHQPPASEEHRTDNALERCFE